MKQWLIDQLRNLRRGPQQIRMHEDATIGFLGRSDTRSGGGKRIEIDAECGEIYPFAEIEKILAKEFADVPSEHICIGIWRRGGGLFSEPRFRIVLHEARPKDR